MARVPVSPPRPGWSLTLRPRDWGRLSTHLFEDGDEHGAVLLAEVTSGPRGPRLLTRQVVLAQDGRDYVPGKHGYRALTAEFVRDAALRARAEGWAYLAVHNHGGTHSVDFSRTDMESHQRGYPALRQLTGQVVGGVVCTQFAATGDLWLPDGSRTSMEELVVPGNNLLRLHPSQAKGASAPEMFERQARLFGDLGQQAFGGMTVVVVGLGGVGSLLVELLSRLGVGHLVLIDADDAERSNLSRLVGAELRDIGHPKVELAARNARRANPDISVTCIRARVETPEGRTALQTGDWIFLSADTHAARHWVNAAVQRQLIPGTQAGVKIPVSHAGEVGRIHAATRLLTPGEGCLWCNGLIDSTELAIDMHPTKERRAARYLEEISAPSVIALNAVAASEAVNHFMLSVAGLHQRDLDSADVLSLPRTRERGLHNHRRSPNCSWCGD